MTKAQLRELIEIQAGGVGARAARGMAAEKVRVTLKAKGLAYRDEGRPWTWHLTEKGCAVLASVHPTGGE